jgi:hypothetical protein
MAGQAHAGHGVDQTAQIERPARLWPRARQTAPAKGLHLHHRTNRVAVDVNIADRNPPGHLGNGFIQSGVQARSTHIPSH